MSENEEIIALCEKYGYGQVMDVACKNWQKYMLSKGNPVSGCLIPVLPMDIKEDAKNLYTNYLDVAQ